MLVRGHGMAGKDGDANQRVVMGDDGSGCGSQPGGNGANRARMRSVSAATEHSLGAIARRWKPRTQRAAGKLGPRITSAWPTTRPERDARVLGLYYALDPSMP